MRPRLLRAICCTVHILPGFRNRGAAFELLFISEVSDRQDGDGGVDVEARVKRRVIISVDYVMVRVSVSLTPHHLLQVSRRLFCYEISTTSFLFS